MLPAVQRCDEPTVEALLALSPELAQLRDGRGASLLHLAAKRHVPTALCLLRHRADVNVLDRYGRTALDLVEDGSEAAFQLRKRGGMRSEELF